MNYPTNKMKKKGILAAITAIVLLFSGLTEADNTLDSNKKTDNFLLYDFGTHPLGISQTTKEFYLCARDIEESSEDSTSEITIIDKKEENQKQLKPKAIHRWNVPDSRSRVNMNQWRKKNRIAIHIDPPYITGDNANAFKLQHNQCHENVLFPGSKCQFDITFQPKGEGKQKANIIIPYSKKGIKEYLTVFVTGSAERKTRQSKVVSIFFQEVKTSAHCQ